MRRMPVLRQNRSPLHHNPGHPGRRRYSRGRHLLRLHVRSSRTDGDRWSPSHRKRRSPVRTLGRRETEAGGRRLPGSSRSRGSPCGRLPASSVMTTGMLCGHPRPIGRAGRITSTTWSAAEPLSFVKRNYSVCEVAVATRSDIMSERVALLRRGILMTKPSYTPSAHWALSQIEAKNIYYYADGSMGTWKLSASDDQSVSRFEIQSL